MNYYALVIYSLSASVGLITFLKIHRSFISFLDRMILFLGTLLGTTCVSIVVHFWLSQTGSGSLKGLFVGLFTLTYGWISPLLIFGFVLGHAARRKAISEERGAFFPILTAVTLAVLTAPLLNILFVIISSFTTIPLLRVLWSILKF